MPVLKAITVYRSGGKQRRIRLYKAWRNLCDRIAGHNHAGNGSRPWMGLENGFESFEHFRQWALEHGYSKTLNSLDRKDDTRGYTPDNCRWTTVSQNTSYENAKRKKPVDSLRDAAITSRRWIWGKNANESSVR
jgi:hypothetical protein